MTYATAINQANLITVLHCSGGLSLTISISKTEAHRLRRATAWMYLLNGQTLEMRPTSIYGTECGGWLCEECSEPNCCDPDCQE